MSFEKMIAQAQPQKLTELQLELLKMFSYGLSQEQLLDIKKLLANYFANKATEEMDKLWDSNSWNSDTMEQWLGEHLRTSSTTPRSITNPLRL